VEGYVVGGGGGGGGGGRGIGGGGERFRGVRKRLLLPGFDWSAKKSLIFRSRGSRKGGTSKAGGIQGKTRRYANHYRSAPGSPLMEDNSQEE